MINFSNVISEAKKRMIEKSIAKELPVESRIKELETQLAELKAQVAVLTEVTE